MINKIRKYFDTQEVVCKHVYDKFGDSAWAFFDPRLLETLLFIREGIGKPIYVNNWQIGGNLSQRGLRCNVCNLVREKTDLKKVYLSAHIFGKGIDFDVKGMTAQQVRDWLEEHKEDLPYKIRVEDCVSWVHIDLSDYGMGKNKITYFKA